MHRTMVILLLAAAAGASRAQMLQEDGGTSGAGGSGVRAEAPEAATTHRGFQFLAYASESGYKLGTGVSDGRPEQLGVPGTYLWQDDDGTWVIDCSTAAWPAVTLISDDAIRVFSGAGDGEPLAVASSVPLMSIVANATRDRVLRIRVRGSFLEWRSEDPNTSPVFVGRIAEIPAADSFRIVSLALGSNGTAVMARDGDLIDHRAVPVAGNEDTSNR